MRPRLVCIPSSDRAFAALAEMRLSDGQLPLDLEDSLRPVYPRVLVHRRELSGERDETWYVYRDGMFKRP